MSSDVLRSLEEIFGGIPSYIDEHLKYFTFDPTNEEYQCVPCGKLVKIVNANQNSTAKNFKAHIFSRNHKEVSSSVDEIVKALSRTFQGKIPQVVFNNTYVLDISENDYKCVICDKILKVKSDPSATECCFSYHLLSFDHKRKWEQHKEKGKELLDVFGEIPGFIKSNKVFIRLTRSGKNFVCTCCNVLLVVNQDELEDTTYRFKYHFYSSEHIRNTKKTKVRSLLPVMRENDTIVPSFLTRNIDYIKISGSDVFCTLCNEIVKCDLTNIVVTEQNLKLHFTSREHEENSFVSFDCDNELYDSLSSITEEFSDTVLKNLKHLRLTENSFSCSICDSEVTQLDTDENCEEIKDDIVDHFESDFHKNNLSAEVESHENLSETLEDLFGGIPSMILENISYLEFQGGNNFKCTLCDAILQTNKNSDDPEHVARITQENFERHLGMSKHTEAIENEERESSLMETELQRLFDPIPQIIYQNWDHIQYDDDNEEFLCVLCDEAIPIDNGNKKEELTLQNFMTHLHSVVHSSNLINRGKKISDVTEKLKSIFRGIPNCILSNLEHLYENENSFFCDACDVEIRLGSCSDSSKKNFHQHLTGSRHKTNIDDIEASIDSAYQFLDNNFCLPEFLSKGIDFLENFCDDLYCTLCQEVLPIDHNDLKETRQSLRYHINSDRHMCNMKHL